MVPNFGRCAGLFPGTFDALDAVQKWREQDAAPDQIKASYSDRGKVYKTRPVCAYPQVAIHNGSGETNDAASFHCGAPTW
jgi:feruloyl esterase